MSDDEILETTITFFPPDVEEVELRTVVFGEDPLILIEPNEDGGIELTLSKIDHAWAGWVCGLLATVLEDNYGEPEVSDA